MCDWSQQVPGPPPVGVTILFPPDLHRHLSELAARLGVSLGDLVRKACEKQCGYSRGEDRFDAIERLGQLGLPVGEVDEMKRESVPDAEDLVP